MLLRLDVAALAAISVVMATQVACTLDYDGFGSEGGGSATGGSTSSAGGSPASSSTTSSSGGVGSTASGTGGSGTGAGGAASTTTAGSGGSGGASSVTAGSGGSGSGGAGPVCGNDRTEPPEECDDGGLIPGDGCGVTCLLEEPDTCPGAAIPLDVGMLVITGDTTGADDTLQDSDGQGPCTTNPSAGPDFIYAVTPSASGTLMASLDAGFDFHWLRARQGCPSGAELDCNFSSNADTDIAISFSVQAGTTYHVVVDSWGGTLGGPFSLRLDLSP